MPTLTYKGFLKLYVREISGLDTNKIDTLAYVACKELPRLRYPLYAYAKEHGQLGQLALAVKKYSSDLTIMTENSKWEQTKLMQVYNYHKNSKVNDDRVKVLMRDKIIQIKEQKGISNYHICKALGLNSGNVNAFIKNGGTSKISLSAAERIFEYLKNH